MANYTPLESIANVRERLHATATSYPNNIGIKHYNRAYKKVIAKIRLSSDEYFYEEAVSNTVANQSEYTITEVNPLYPEEITRVKRVFIKYASTDTYYTPAREVDPDLLPY